MIGGRGAGGSGMSEAGGSAQGGNLAAQGGAVADGAGGVIASSGGAVVAAGFAGATVEAVGGTSSLGGAPQLGGAASTLDGGTAHSGGAAGEAGDVSSGQAGDNGCMDECKKYGGACCIPSVACVPKTSCVFDVLAAWVPIAANYDELETIIAQAAPDKLLSFTSADIVWAAAERPQAARFEFRLSPDASAHYGPTLASRMVRAFRVTCDGQPLFDGLIYLREGAAVMKLPVLHVVREADNSITLLLGAEEGLWELGISHSDEASRARIDRPELRAALCLE